jgi:competence protein ComEA
MKFSALAAAGAFTLIAGVVPAAADDLEAKQLPEGTGKESVVKVCMACHGSGAFRKLRLTKEGWTEKVADMVERGAEANEGQQAVVVDYLTQRFGKASKVYINTAPFEELKAVLGLTVEESRAVLAWRKENGDFKTWQDLLKAPGVDAKKLESKKELIVF